jgi:class 3 adenylate cyclase
MAADTTNCCSFRTKLATIFAGVVSGLAHLIPWGEQAMDTQRLDLCFSRLAQLREVDAATVHSLARWIAESSPIDRLRINPYSVAESKQLDVKPLVSAFLLGTQTELFDLSWEVHCPRCNMLTEHFASVAQAREQSSCPMCEFSFRADLSDRIEVTFSLNRAIEDLGFPPICLPPAVLKPIGGVACPQGQIVTIVEQLATGQYRYYCPLTLSKGVLEVAGEPSEETQSVNLTQQAGRVLSPSAVTVRPGRVQFVLSNVGHPVSGLWVHTNVLLEDIPVSSLKRRLSGLELLHYPIYQRLFGDRVLSARERLQVSSITVVFTDITGSTRMYEEIGDPMAYNLVRDHFEIIQRVFESIGGRLVKTIGDAVMASFLSNRAALRAIEEAQRQLDKYNQTVPAAQQIHLRFGMHRGPAIVVNMNGQLDYFGRTVNKAARVQTVARSDELSVSEEVFLDPDFQAACSGSSWSDFRKSVEDLRGIAGSQRVYTAQRIAPNLTEAESLGPAS